MSKTTDADQKNKRGKMFEEIEQSIHTSGTESASKIERIELNEHLRQDTLEKYVVIKHRDNTEYLELIDQMNMLLEGE